MQLLLLIQKFTNS